MPGERSFHERLRQAYGANRVVDVFKDTGMEEHALRLGFGAYVVRNAITEAVATNWHEALIDSLVAIAKKNESRSVELKGAKVLW